jgi:hypothetical protein
MAHIIGSNGDGTYTVFSTVVMGVIEEKMPVSKAVETYGREAVEAAPIVGSDEWKLYTEPVVVIRFGPNDSITVEEVTQ